MESEAEGKYHQTNKYPANELNLDDTGVTGQNIPRPDYTRG